MSSVFVGLSGGVDSAVAAAKLIERKHDVTAVFMKNWSGVTAGVTCPWQDDLASARRVAAHLNIPLKVYDFEHEYRATVAAYLVETYQAGLTPNPDIMCNEAIKFKTFFEKCLDEGAEFIATGHYARKADSRLLRGCDRNKDQSYFLYRISGTALDRTLFPIGEFTKPQVRQQARRFGLPNAGRADSQGLCFVGPVPMKEFLHQFIGYKPGDVVDEEGGTVGQHDGIFFYTIGQRHGLGIGGGKPYFVFGKDVKRNILYVTTDPQAAVLNRDQFEIADCVWRRPLAIDTDYTVQVRYRAAGVAGQITSELDGRFTVRLSEPERAVTPGQSAVLYDGDTVVGGGLII